MTPANGPGGQLPSASGLASGILGKSRVVPYVGAWVGRRRLTTTPEDIDTGAEPDMVVSGWAVGASGGVQYFVSPHLAIDGGLSVGIGKMNHFKVAGRRETVSGLDNTTTTRLQLGMNWYP